MSYEKYLKYKSKYLNLKAQHHNDRLINQNGGANSPGSLQSLGSSPASNFSQNGGGNSLQSLGSSPADDSNQNSGTDTDGTDANGSLQSLGSSPEDSQPEDQLVPTRSSRELLGGKKLVRKERDEFSDSDYDTTESSLLSFSSVESTDSDDTY